MKKILTVSVSLIFLISCESNQKLLSSEVIDKLSANAWIPESLKGESVDEDDYMKGLPELEFLKEGTVRGSTGCNSFKGTFLLKDQNITIDPGAMTKMNCPGDGEAEFLNAINSVTGAKMEDNSLVLMSGAEEIMKLIPKKENE